MLRSDLCDYSDAYIVVKRAIIVESNNANSREDKILLYKTLRIMPRLDQVFQKSITHS